MVAGTSSVCREGGGQPRAGFGIKGPQGRIIII